MSEIKKSNKLFKENSEYRIHRIKHFGKKYGWNLMMDESIFVFLSNEAILRIDINLLTIETELIHPKKGETKLLRQGDFTQPLIEKIFRNPRAHMPPEIESKYMTTQRNEHC